VLDRLTVDDFAPAVGQAFTVDGGDAGAVDLELIEAKLYGSQAATDPSGRRSPFHLLFRGPPDPVLAQQTLRLENATLGPLEIFVVPVGHTEDGTDYEAIFT
jgi:hypothetical protein